MACAKLDFSGVIIKSSLGTLEFWKNPDNRKLIVNDELATGFKGNLSEKREINETSQMDSFQPVLINGLIKRLLETKDGYSR